MHGGLSPDLSDMEQIKRIVRPTDVPDSGKLIFTKRIIFKIGLICDLLWSDPEYDVLSWEESERGVSYVFGADIVKDFLKNHDLDLICRAHQVTFQNLNSNTNPSLKGRGRWV